MDLTAIQAAISSLKTASEISKTILEIKSIAEVQGKVIELQTAILEAQSCALSATSAQFELQEKVRELETKLNKIGDWNTEKQKYALITPWRAPAQVYALKKSNSNGEEPHLLCPNCFHRGAKTILNPVKINNWVQMQCPSCKAMMDTGYRGIDSPKYFEEYLEEKKQQN